MAGRTVEYLINLRDHFSPMAAKVAQAAKAAQNAMSGMANASKAADAGLNQAGNAASRMGQSLNRAAADAKNASRSLLDNSAAAHKARREYDMLAGAAARLKSVEANRQRMGGGGNQPPGGGDRISRFTDGANNLMFGLGGYGALNTVRTAVKEFAEFERVMVRLERVYPGAREEFDKATKALDELSTRLPVTRADIYKLATEAAKSDIINERTPMKTAELERYVALAAEFKEAFELPIDTAATYLAKLKSSLDLTIPELRSLGDRMMWFEQKTAADPREILEIVRRNASLANALGGKQGVMDMLALGGAQVSAGVRPDVAATGMRTFLVRLQQAAGMNLSDADKEHLEEAGFTAKDLKSAEAGLKTARSALMKLGFADPQALNKSLKTDLFGTVQQIVKAIAALPEQEQAGVISRLAGVRAFEALAPLISNPKLLETAREVRDATEGAGALARAYQKNLGLLQSTFTRFNNSLGIVKTNIVGQWAPTINWMTEGLLKLNKAMIANPIFGKAMAWGAGILTALAALSLFGATLGFIAMGLSAIPGRMLAWRAATWLIANAIRVGILWPLRAALWTLTSFPGAAAVARVALLGLRALGPLAIAWGLAEALGLTQTMATIATEMLATVQAIGKAFTEWWSNSAEYRKWKSGYEEAERQQKAAGINPTQNLLSSMVAWGQGDRFYNDPAMRGRFYADPKAREFGMGDRGLGDYVVKPPKQEISVTAPPEITVRVTGTINGPVEGSGRLQLGAAPRGASAAEPVAPPVQR